MSKSCSIKEVHTGQMVTDGAGVSIYRIIAHGRLDYIDPFVLLDELRTDNPDDYIAGFPMHPHRGIETVTYMIHGKFHHKDSRGGGGLLTDGCVQWMTAGKGIQHSEMPEITKDGLWGYQLWLNLPQRHKFVEPRYQHLSPQDMPLVQDEPSGLSVRIISGSYKGIEGPASNWVKTHYFDVRLKGGAEFSFTPDEGMTGFFYVHTGAVRVCGRRVHARELAELEAGGSVAISADADEAGFLYLAGVPNREPIARGGPFVMNTQQEIRQAFEDYRNGILF